MLKPKAVVCKLLLAIARTEIASLGLPLTSWVEAFCLTQACQPGIATIVFMEKNSAYQRLIIHSLSCINSNLLYTFKGNKKAFERTTFGVLWFIFLPSQWFIRIESNCSYLEYNISYPFFLCLGFFKSCLIKLEFTKILCSKYNGWNK